MPYQPMLTLRTPGPAAIMKMDLTRSTSSTPAISVSYIPADFEVWPIYYNTIMKILFQHPDVHDAAVAAVRETAQKLTGLENRDIPPALRSG